MAFFGGDMQKRLKCEVVDKEGDIPRLVCKVYEIDEEGNVVRVQGEATILVMDNGIIFENIDIETGSLEEFKQLIAKTLKPHKPGTK